MFLDTIRNLVRSLGRREVALLIALLLLTGGAWGFIELADEVLEGQTQTFDEWMLLALRNPADLSDPVGPEWVEELGRDFTALGGVGILLLVTVAAVGYLLLKHRRRTALFVAVAIGGGMLMSQLLKMGFSRPRPDLVPHETYVYTTSFPSGHSMMSALTYLTLTVVLAYLLRARRREQLYLLVVAVVLTVAIGVSRVYMGVHYPTDVLAGWTAGTFWALLSWVVAFWLQQRGVLESAPGSSVPR